MKSFSCFLFLLLTICFTSFAAAQMKSDPVGTWAGPMTTVAGPGGLELTLKHPKPPSTQWLATLTMRLQGQESKPAVRNLLIKGEDISFDFDLDGSLVKVAGKFAGDKLNGTVEAFQGERKIGDGTFALTFGGQMPPLQQAVGGQQADPDFNAKVDHPAYSKDGPKVLFDEAHNNFHTASGRYKPFADLIASDGYQITPNKQTFSAETLKGYRVLVISNAIGAARMNDPNATNPAFTEAESDAVREWVRGGGSLLLIADHAPMGSANQILGQRFGVDMSKMYTIDLKNSDPQNPGLIIYTRESGRLADHPVTRGRNASEQVNKVIAFTGQSLKGPADSVSFMSLADTAGDTMPGRTENPVSAAGRSQGIAMKFGKGRVIVLGEAGMLTAQVSGAQRNKFGMNRPGIDNRQLALNIMHWLSGKLK